MTGPRVSRPQADGCSPVWWPSWWRAGYAAASNASPLGVWIFVVVLAGWVITLCLHEFAHAATALAGGDTSVRASGYLTLNPFRYVNAAYSIVMPLIILVIGGIPLPGGSVLIENHRLRSRAGPVWCRSPAR